MSGPPAARRPPDDPPELPEGAVPLLDPAGTMWRARPRTVALFAAAAAAVAAGAAWLALRPTPAERLADLRELARTEIVAERADLAEALLARALEIDPRDPDALFLLGALRAQTGRPDDAERLFREALASRPRHVLAGTALARSLLRRGDAGGALVVLDPVVASAGADSAPRSVRAEARLELGDLEGALDDLVVVAANPPDAHAAAQVLLAGHVADFLARTTRTPRFREVADDLYRRVPFVGGPRGEVPPLVAAEAHLAAGRTRTALALAEALPPQAAVAVLRADGLRADGAEVEAEAVLRDEIAREDAAAPRAALVRLLAASGRLRSAALELDEARRRYPGDPAVRHAAGSVRRPFAPGTDEPDLLAALLRAEPAAYNPAEPLLADRVLAVARGELARRAAVSLRAEALFARSTGPDDASADVAAFASSIEAAVQADPADAEARLWRAVLALRAGRLEDATDDLDVVVAAGPEPRLLLVRAIARGAAGRWAAALEDVRAAYGTEPPDAAAACVEIRVWAGLGDRDSALGAARRAAARWPADLLVAWHLRAALGDAPDAAASPGTADERRWLDARIRFASLGPAAFRDAVRAVADGAASASVPPAALAGLWDDIAAEWAARERSRPDDASAALAHATSLVRAGRPRRAEDVLRIASERIPADSLVVARVRLLVQLGAYDAAETAFRALRDARRGDPAIELEMGTLQVARGNLRDGLAAYRRVLAAPGAAPGLQSEAAQALAGGEELSADDAELVLAWLATPAGAAADPGTRRILEGACRLALGNPEAAVAAGEEVLRADPGRVRAAVVAARGWLAEGRADRAESVLAGALAASPGDRVLANLAANVRLALGLRAFDSGDRAGALAWWGAALTGADLDFVAVAALADLRVRGADVRAISDAAARVATRRPGSAAASLLRGRVEAARGRPESARADFREALARDPAHPAVVAAFVAAESDAGDLESAARACRRAIDAGDRFGFVHSLLAGIETRRGDAGAAERAWREALRRDPANLGAVDALSRLLVESGRDAEARALVAATDPRSLPAPGAAERFGRLRVWVETGPVAGAIDRLRAVLEGRPGNAEAALAFGRALARTGDHERALPWLEGAFEEAPDRIETGLALLRSLDALGRIAEADAKLAERTAARPSDAGAWCLRGMVASAEGRPGLAEAHYRRALAVAPDDPLAANNLACVVFESEGRRREALDLIARAAHARPEVSRLSATHGWLLLRNGDPAAALAVLDDAVLRHPGDPLVRLHRAEALLALGRRTSAASEYRAAVRADPAVESRASEGLREAARPPGGGAPPETSR